MFVVWKEKNSHRISIRIIIYVLISIAHQQNNAFGKINEEYKNFFDSWDIRRDLYKKNVSVMNKYEENLFCYWNEKKIEKFMTMNILECKRDFVSE